MNIKDKLLEIIQILKNHSEEELGKLNPPIVRGKIAEIENSLEEQLLGSSLTVWNDTHLSAGII